MVNIAHWRVLHNGSVLFVYVSDHDHDHLRPLQSDHVRAELYPSGYLLTATTNGTIVNFLRHVSTILFCINHRIYYFSATQSELLSPNLLTVTSPTQPTDALNQLKVLLDKDKRNGYIKYPVDHVTNYFRKFLHFYFKLYFVLILFRGFSQN
jgi:hypothetical protein